MEGYPHMQAMRPGMHPGMQAMGGMMMPPGIGHDGPPWKRQRMDDGQFGSRGNKEGSVFYKTRMCNRWQEGSCTFGDRCNYAHGEQELRELAPEGHDILQKRAARLGLDQGSSYQEPAEPSRSPDPTPRPPIVSKFSAPVAQPINTPPSTAGTGFPGVGQTPAEPPEQDSDSGQPADRATEQRRAQYFKSRLCHTFMRGASCSYGDRCQYAHGPEELRQPHREGSRSMQEGRGHGFHPGMMGMGMGGMGPMGPMDMFPPGMAGMGPGGPMGGLPFPGGPMMPGMDAGAMRPPPPRPPPGPGPPASLGTPGSEAVSPAPSNLDTFSPAQAVPEVPLLDRIRATCSLLGLSALKPADVSKAALDAAAAAVRTGDAFRQSPYADAVSVYMH